MKKTFLNETVIPYRSLSKKAFKNLMFIISLVFFSIGIVFFYIGAWPVFGFLGLDVLLLYWAFKINYKSGEIFENLMLIKRKLLITRNFPSGKKQTWNLEPYWTKVEIQELQRHRNQLVLRSKEKVVFIGSFLNNHDKIRLKNKILNALKNYKIQFSEKF